MIQIKGTTTSKRKTDRACGRGFICGCSVELLSIIFHLARYYLDNPPTSACLLFYLKTTLSYAYVHPVLDESLISYKTWQPRCYGEVLLGKA